MITLKKYNFHVNDIDCAACALKIEEELKKDEHYENVSLNFGKLKLSFDTNMKEHDVKNYTENIIKKVEPDCTITLEENKKETSYFQDILRLFIGVALFFFSFLFHGVLREIFIIASYIILLYKVGTKAIKLLPKLILDENILLVISCFGAYLIDKKSEGLMVIVLYEIGKILESRAINNTRKSIASLMEIAPVSANIKKNKEIIEVTPYDICVDDIVVVKLGEKVPVDGILLSKSAKLDASSLTGESKLVELKKDSEVLSGSINMAETFEMRATKVYSDSTISQILNLVETASSKKTKAENFVEKCAKIYTPIVIILASLCFLLLPSFLNVSYTESYYRALSFLVIACPCAIVISVPLSYFSGIGRASSEGILVKGSTYLDMARKINKIVFDKTGTITTGSFEVVNVVSTSKYDKEEIYRLIYLGESYSTHPIAKSILSYKKIKNKEEKIQSIKEEMGLGISYKLKKHTYKIGNKDYVKNDIKTENTSIFISEDDEVIGYVELKDIIKKDSKEAISELKASGILTYMYTGDKKEVASDVAKQCGVNSFECELLPKDKYTKLEKLIKKNEKEKYVVFVGDGVNDAPVLALSDIGISMGLKGSNVAIEASDVVIMRDSLTKINRFIAISKYTNKIIIENLLFAFFIKILFLILAVFGLSQMWEAVFADVGVTLLTILNTLRILKK